MPQLEYRIRCSIAHTNGHRGHVYRKPDLAAAVKAADRANSEHADDPPPGKHFRRLCPPWIVEAREIGDWTSVIP